MEQRRLRLGDIIDDYCPRERRLSNHAIVAMVEDRVKQTRCTTCDAEHPYKGGKAPRRRTQKEAPAALFQEVLAGRGDAAEAGEAHGPAPSPAPPAKPEIPLLRAPRAEAPPALPGPVPAVAAPPDSEPRPGVPARVPEEGPVHRRLIRATLPRVEGQVPVRQIPEFTMRQAGVRRGSHRDGNGQGFPGDGFRAGGQAPPKGGRRHGRGGKPQGLGGANGNRPAGAGGHGGRGRGPRGRHGGKKPPR